ncbi:hypothetical protein GGI35DRAFT_445751 [Trichoderma velutinum]
MPASWLLGYTMALVQVAFAKPCERTINTQAIRDGEHVLPPRYVPGWPSIARVPYCVACLRLRIRAPTIDQTL